MAQVLGLVQLSWRGTNIPVEKGAKVTLGGLQQKTVVVGSQANFMTEFMPSKIEATTVMTRGLSLLGIFSPGQGPLQVKCDTGQTYDWDDAFMTKLPDFADSGGKVAMSWEAGAAVEIVG